MSFEPLRSDQTITERGGFIGAFFHRWLRQLVIMLQLVGYPYRGVALVALTADEITQWFDVDGLGLASGPYRGWGICNGNDGRPSLDGKFPRFATTAAGGTGGSDSSAHAHSTPAHAHDGTGLFAHVDISPAGGQVLLERAAHAFTSTHEATATSASASAVARTNAAIVAGTTAADGAGTSGAASASDNRPAFYELVPVMRVIA